MSAPRHNARVAASGGGAVTLAPSIVWVAEQFGLDMSAVAAAGFAAAIGWVAMLIERATRRD